MFDVRSVPDVSNHQQLQHISFCFTVIICIAIGGLGVDLELNEKQASETVGLKLFKPFICEILRQGGRRLRLI